ncbi:hypothetical protein Tco_0622368 [Tanacetum coccineum]
MDDPNMTMEEYIKFEEEKACRRGRVFNWQTATYGKVRVDDGLYDLGYVEAELPAIVIDDTVTPHDVLPCKSQVSTPVNDEIDFRISFDESDDEDYTITCDINSFSYKIISVNNLKTDSENDNEKAGIHSFSPPNPTTSYIDDLDLFNDFENKFLAIVYNDAQTSKLDLLTEPILNPRYIDEFNNETSVSEYDEEEQNILYFNDIFPFNIICPDDLKSGKDKNDNDVDIIHSSEGNKITHRTNMLMDTSCDKIDKIFNEESFVLELNVNIVTWTYLFNGMLLCFIMNLYVPFGILFDPKRYYKDGDCAIMLRRPRYHGLEYTDEDIADFKEKVKRIYSREIHRLGGARRRLSWRQFILALGLHTEEEMKSLSFARDISTDGDFLGPPPSYTLIRDLVLRLCHRMLAHSTTGRKSEAYISGGQFVARLAEYFGLLTAKILGGLTVIAPELPIIDMGELVRLQISVQFDDTWAWVAIKPERQPNAVAGVHAIAEDAPIVDEGGQADPAPIHAPPPPPALARIMPQRMARLEEDVHKIRGVLTEQREVIDAMARDFSRFSTWVTNGLGRMMDRAGVTYVAYAQTRVSYQRRVRQRTG